MGNTTLSPHPASTPVVDLTRDFHQLHEKHPGESELTTWFKTGKNNIRDWTPKANETPLVIPVGTGGWCIVVYPVATPLVYGLTLIMGDLTSPDVKKQLQDYHPAMADWINAVSFQVLTGKPCQACATSNPSSPQKQTVASPGPTKAFHRHSPSHPKPRGGTQN
eukprot:scaffold315492_cov46-Attheya_sp.AAC.2